MKNKPVIAVDIDDVLAANAEGLIAFSNKRWGTSLKIADYEEHWSNMWKIDHDETEKRATELHESGAIGLYPHDESALSVLRDLQQSYSLVVVTSRQKSIEIETHAWLSRYFDGIFDAVYFAGIFDSPIVGESFMQTKASIYKQINASYIIDDQLKHCEGAAQLGLSSILFGNYPWNQTIHMLENVVRCEDWSAVKRYFNGKV